jgi:DNA replication protein DnaC
MLTPGVDYEQFIRLQDIKKDIKNWVRNGDNLYLYSDNFGNGKTSWSIKLLLAYFNAVWAGNSFRRRGIFISVPEFLDRNREVMSNRDEEFVQLRNDILSCDLVVWDDITSTKLTDYNHGMLLNYIDARMVAYKSNIFTGNADSSKLTEYLGGRLASRIWNTSELVRFSDVDKRSMRHG